MDVAKGRGESERASEDIHLKTKSKYDSMNSLDNNKKDGHHK